MKITARTALTALTTALIVAACSSDDGATPPDVTGDGGVVQPGADGGDGGAADGAAADSAAPKCGRTTMLCAEGQPCSGPQDCVSNFCQDICTEASHVDGKKDDGETGVDCGGTAPKKCPTGQGCVSNADCDHAVCDAGMTNLCLPPSHTDGITNDGETGIDCGGTAPTPCPTGQGCATNADCDHLACDTKAVPPVCEAPSNTDGVKNGDETGIDCGGPTAPNRCAPGQGCAADGDCANTRCNPNTLVCDPATSSDGLKNGTETDVDCGGGAPTNAPGCAAGLACGAVDANCASKVCNYNSVCVEAPSCRNQHGGDTCGPAGSTESCCVSPPVGGVHLDKYSITAGRMRTFVEDAAINGNIHDYIVNHKPAWWNDAWTAFLPTMMDNGKSGPDDAPAWSGFYQDVGPFVHGTAGGGNEGCYVRGNGARTYRLPDAVNARLGTTGDEQDFPREFLDERALNCTPVYIFAAFCAWDGAQLADKAILDTAWGPKKFPWGDPTRAETKTDPGIGNPAGYDYAYPMDPNGTFGNETYGSFQGNPKVAAPFTPNPDELWASFNYNYWGGATQVSSKTCDLYKTMGVNGSYCDQSIFVAPPGRFPNGNSASGHADIAGNVFNSTLTFNGANVYWSRNGSWEGHFIPYPVSTFPPTNKYLAMGGRCVRP